MNADELKRTKIITRGLRWLAKVRTYCDAHMVNCKECEFTGFCTDPDSDESIGEQAELLGQAADLIDSLTAQLTEATQIALDVTSKYETSVKMHKITADLLTASQRREKAAAEFFAKLLLLCDVAPKDRTKVFRNYNAGPGDYLGTGFVFVDAFNQFIEEFYDTADAELYESVMDEVERRRGPQEAEKGDN